MGAGMNKVWFTSDTHFWHARIIQFCQRPFASVDEMNEKLIANWNAVVVPDDTVYHLGDFSMAARPVELYVPRLNGQIHLVMGNHDFPHSAHKKSKNPENQSKWKQQYLDWGFRSVETMSYVELPEIGEVRMHHIPYSSGYTELDEEGRQRKVLKYACQDDGMVLLCGHVHEKWWHRKTPNGTLMLNVGIDAPGSPWNKEMRPASQEEVVAAIKEFR
jgi:calcineurin-like phosphoesterase family protein